MTPLALDRSVLVQVMAGNAEFVCNLLAPLVYFVSICFMAVKAFIFLGLLVFPVLERELHDSHFKIDDFRANIFWFISMDQRAGYHSKGEDECERFHSDTPV